MAFSIFQPFDSTGATDFPVIVGLIQSASGKCLYTFCKHACLGNADYGDILFKTVLRHALARRKSPPVDVELWLFTSFHAVWRDFPRQRPGLAISAVPRHLDWTRARAHQWRDALYMLTPPEREIFLYRFFLTCATPRIARMTGLKTARIHGIFTRALRKVAE